MYKNIKYIITILFFLFIQTKTFATEWTTYICFFTDSTSGSQTNITYLRPVAYYDCLSFSLEDQAYSIMEKFVAYHSVFDYEKIEDKGGNLYVFLKAKALSKIERQELITSLLIHGFNKVTLVFAGGTERTYSKKDVCMPFFLPVYFEDQSLSNHLFIRNAWEMIRLAYEADSRYRKEDNTVIHYVQAGETVYGIAKQYGILEDELTENNPEIENSPLQIGQELIVFQNNKSSKNDRKTTHESSRPNIAIYILLGLSVLLNGCLIVKNRMTRYENTH